MLRKKLLLKQIPRNTTEMSKVDYSVNWETLSTHLQERQRELYNESHFADVTLVSDDQVKFKVHKFVLNACSPVFESILQD